MVKQQHLLYAYSRTIRTKFSSLNLLGVSGILVGICLEFDVLKKGAVFVAYLIAGEVSVILVQTGVKYVRMVGHGTNTV